MGLALKDAMVSGMFPEEVLAMYYQDPSTCMYMYSYYSRYREGAPGRVICSVPRYNYCNFINF